jgi:uncharacterized damage-inducible protein DinB
MQEQMVLFQTMARYSAQMNAQLYAACSNLSDEERRRDRGAWFRSIHGTLNHILVADKLWMGRFTGRPFSVAALDSELFETWDELHAERAAFDGVMVDWIDNLKVERLRETLVFRALSRPGEYSRPLWLCVAHVWNHATHHRGQATAMMNAAGADSGVTDLPALESVTAWVDEHLL